MLEATLGKRFYEVEVERAAQSRFDSAIYRALRGIKCRFERGKLLLSGRVPSFYHKQLAQETVRNLPGVDEIVNDVMVRGTARTAHDEEELVTV